jgi:NAD-dependent SIR2 family protein deacetylase
MKYTNIVILTGAGISEESGIQTFRGALGLWENHRIEDVAHPIAFQKNPELVHRFYNERRRRLQSSEIAPNPAHFALKELEDNSFAHFLLVIRNIFLHHSVLPMSVFSAYMQVNTHIAELETVFQYLTNQVMPAIVSVSTLNRYAEESFKNESAKDYILRYLQKADFNISNITSKEQETQKEIPSFLHTSCDW